MKTILSVIFCMVLFSCVSNTDQPPVGLPEGATQIEKTDSIVVQNLIDQSNKNYNAGADNVVPFDSFLKEAEVIAIRNQYEVQLSVIYNLIGKRYRNRSIYDEALQYHKKALVIAERLKRNDLLTEYYNQLGVVYRRMDENTFALDVHLKALQLAEALQDSFQIGVAFNGIGNVNLNLKRYHAAIEYFKKSMKLASTRSNGLGMAINTNNIGEAFLGLNQPDSALHYFFVALEHNSNIQSRIGQAICYNSIGDAYVVKGHTNLAFEYLKKALAINLEEGDLLYVSVSYSHLGKTYLEAGEYQNAIYYFEEGLKIGQQIGSKYQMEETTRLLAKAYELQGNAQKALELFRLSSIYKDSLINEKNIHHISSMEAILESEEQQNKILTLSQEKATQEVTIAQQRTIIIIAVLLALAFAFSIAMVVYQSRLRMRFKSIRHQQQLLRSQMNPHFIFNALSAIQVFILENNMEKSSNFLSDFAKLMRQVLRSSHYEYISLKEEIDVIGYYLKLQQLRFDTPFEYFVHVDDDLDIDKVMMPPMLTQPFLENAIEHGFRHLSVKGEISVRFLSEDGSLVIEVDDNGIGLEQSIKERVKDEKHESMALKITRERLEILEKDARGKTSFFVKDKKRINPFDRGTLVRFVLPMVIFERKSHHQA
jgi:tetratricopeptide (TPR) repeat protein